jgi:hypothetical protein
MRKTLKFLHTLAACGTVGALLSYGIILLQVPVDPIGPYVEARRSIEALCRFLLLPSLVLALPSGLLSFAFHWPFHSLKWVWLKAVLGLSLFEGTLLTIQATATERAEVAAKVAAREATAETLQAALVNEWLGWATILALVVAQIALGVWRPRLSWRGKEAVER